MSRNHLAFKNFPEPVVTATDALFQGRPHSANEEQQEAMAQEWATTVAAEYDLPPVLVRIDRLSAYPVNYTRAVQWQGTSAEIVLSKFSFSHLFVGMALHRHAVKPQSKSGKNPQGWAASLYYKVRPRLFRRVARNGQIPGVTARDTFTEATWARIQAAGLDPSASDVIRTLARIDAGEEMGFGSVESLSADDEAAALDEGDEGEDMPDDETLTEDDTDDESPEAEVAALVEEAAAAADEVPISETATDDGAEDLASMNTRALRRYATQHGIAGAWDKDKATLLAELGVTA